MTKTFTGFVMVDEAGDAKAGRPKRGAGAKFAVTTERDPDRIAAAIADVEAGRSVLLQLDPDLAVHHRPAVAAFLHALIRTAERADIIKQEALISRLAEVMLPDDLAEARATLAADNLEVRDRFVADIPVLTSKDVAALSGTTSRNAYATAARWRESGKVFSVPHRGRDYFPAFQFRDGHPHSAIKAILAALPAAMSAWQKAFWFVSTNGWLDDKAPVDRLDEQKQVVAAAHREADPVIG